MDIHIHRCTCVAQPGEVIDHGLFVSGHHKRITKMQICGIQLCRHGSSAVSTQIGQKGNKTIDELGRYLCGAGKLAKR